MENLDARVASLEDWRKQVGPMLQQLAEDQAYRRRWRDERNRTRAVWTRRVTWTVGVASGLAVVAASLAELVHLL